MEHLLWYQQQWKHAGIQSVCAEVSLDNYILEKEYVLNNSLVISWHFFNCTTYLASNDEMISND